MSVWKEEKIFTYSIHFKTFFALGFGTKLLEIQHSLMILRMTWIYGVYHSKNVSSYLDS
jgi:hypothetical protein